MVILVKSVHGLDQNLSPFDRIRQALSESDDLIPDNLPDREGRNDGSEY